MTDPFHLQRFLDAQSSIYTAVLNELEQGYKLTHWMWFIFPQLIGLGRSPTAKYYAIKSVAEADAYLRQALLGPRLRECTRLVLTHREKSAETIFGYPDVVKFHSCMTLFREIDIDSSLFGGALEQFYTGKPDKNTLLLLQQMS